MLYILDLMFKLVFLVILQSCFIKKNKVENLLIKELNSFESVKREIINLTNNNKKIDLTVKNKNGKNVLFLIAETFDKDIKVLRSILKNILSNIDEENVLKILTDKDNQGISYLDYLEGTNTATLQISLLREALVNKGVKLNLSEENLGLLTIAIEENNSFLLEDLLEIGFNANKLKNELITPLHLAISLETINILNIKILLAYKANPNLMNEEGDTTLLSVIKGVYDKDTKVELIKILLNGVKDIEGNINKADITAKDKYNNTALYLANLFKEREILDILEANKCGINLRNSLEKYPISLTLYDEIRKLLRNQSRKE